MLQVSNTLVKSELPLQSNSSSSSKPTIAQRHPHAASKATQNSRRQLDEREAASSTGSPVEATAELSDASQGGEAQQAKQPASMPESCKPASNEGRLVVSQEALLRWLHSKAS